MSGPDERPPSDDFTLPPPPPWSPPTAPPSAPPTQAPGYGGWASPADPTAVGSAPVGPTGGAPAAGGDARPPQVGDQLGPYRLDDVLTTDGDSSVFVATDQRLGRQVAVEVLTTRGLSNEDAERFGDTAARLARLDSPHVLAVYDHGNADGFPWRATRYAPGGDLATMLRARGAMPPGLAALVGAQVADGLTDAHAAGILHGALRPGAVLLRDDRPDRMHVYVSDFGSGASAAAYRAPEAAGGVVDPRGDVYALGCLLHEVLTGRPPYSGATDAALAEAHRSAPVPQVSASDPIGHELNRVLAGTLAKDPAQRYPSAAVLRDDLRAISGRQSTPSAPPAPPGAASRAAGGPRRRRGLLLGGIAAGVVLLLVAGGVAFAVLGGDDDPSGGGGGGGGTDPEPAAAAVAGDLDDDGFGDVWSVESFEPATTLPSDGSGFGEPGQAKQVNDPAVFGDADGDGALDVIELQGTSSSGPATAEVHLSAGSRQSTLLTLPPGQEDLTPSLAAADLDADGDDDLVIITQARGNGAAEYTFSVSLMEDGRPTELAEAATLTLDFPFGELAAGDFDGDGAGDILLKSDATDGGDEVRLLRGAEGALEDPVISPVEYPGTDYYFAPEMYGGNVDGEEGDEVVLAAPDGSVRVMSLDESGEQFGPAEVWVSPTRQEDYSLQGTLSDVDGDGLADFVRAGEDRNDEATEISVLRSTGESFEQDPAFDGLLPAPFPTLLGSVSTF